MWVAGTERESLPRNFKIFIAGYIFCKRGDCDAWKVFFVTASFSVEGGLWKSSCCVSKSFSTEWNWNSMVIVTSPRIGNSVESNYKFRLKGTECSGTFPEILFLATCSKWWYSLFIIRLPPCCCCCKHKGGELERAVGSFWSFQLLRKIFLSLPASTNIIILLIRAEQNKANGESGDFSDLSIYWRYIGCAPIYWTRADWLINVAN